MSTFTDYIVFPTEAEAQAYADLLTEEKITDEHRANGTTAYTAPIELENGSWALQIEPDVDTPVGATREATVQTKIVPFPM